MAPLVAVLALVPVATLAALVVAVRWLRRGGLARLLYGSPVESVVGELELDRRGILRSRVRVHRLSSPVRPIGIELTFTTFASWQRIPVVLSRDQARVLADFLVRAQDPT